MTLTDEQRTEFNKFKLFRIHNITNTPLDLDITKELVQEKLIKRVGGGYALSQEPFCIYKLTEKGIELKLQFEQEEELL